MSNLSFMTYSQLKGVLDYVLTKTRVLFLNRRNLSLYSGGIPKLFTLLPKP